MDYAQEKEDYILQNCTPEDPLLTELRRETQLKMLNPRMVSGHYQGKLLEMLSFMICPDRILEIGTYTGYSAICMARGLKETGKLHTIEINDEITDFAKGFINRSGMSEKIIMHTGDALDIIPDLKGHFDLVFIDGNKTEYSQYLQLVLPVVKPGGFILADNVLWGSKVFGSNNPGDKYTRGILEFNSLINNNIQLENLMLPIRDGLTIIRKK